MKTKHKFVPLKLQIENSSNATIQVVCRKTGERLKWNDAARAGWVADANGVPFDSYYSPEGRAEVEKS